MKIYLGLLIMSCQWACIAQLDVASITESLKKDANAVYLFNYGEFEIGKVDKARYKVHYAITIFNKEADYMAQEAVFYDKLIKVTSFEASVYDKNGKRTRKAKRADFTDESSVSGYSLYEDNRVTWIDLRQHTYPYTVEFEFEIKYKHLYSIPDWAFVPYENIGVVESDFEIIYPKDIEPRHRANRFEGQFDSTYIDDLVHLKWKVSNFKGIEREPYGPPFSELVPTVKVAPGKFDYEGYEGNLSTWDGFAKWQTLLNKDRDELSPETVSKISSLTQGMSPIEKIKTVYEYVQNSTRYVSVQLGIGGFQPIPAKVVDEVGYGDCKALCFYTQSLLKSIGISAYYSWVYGGPSYRKVNEDFPNDTFNHIILCVPVEQDTIWLECTSQTNPFGYLGSFTGGRKALVINEDKGTIVNTKSYTILDNKTINKAEFRLDTEGNAQVGLILQHQGLNYEDGNLRSVVNQGPDDQKKWIERNVSIPSFIVTDFKILNQKDLIPTAVVDARISARKIISKSGNRFFLQPNILNKTTFIPTRNSDRKNVINIPNSSSEYDTITFYLPKGTVLEASFDTLTYNSQFGKYEATFQKSSSDKLIYTRKFEIYQGEYAPETYQELYEFFKKVSLADKKRVSLIEKT